MAEEYLVADTSVLSHLTKTSEHAGAYQKMLGERWWAVSFQTKPELLAWNIGLARRQRVNDLLAATRLLPNSEATGVWYSRVVPVRKELKRSGRPGGDAGEADIWIIASAMEHRLPLVSHDTQQVHLGRAMGLRVLTNLEGLREDNPRS